MRYRPHLDGLRAIAVYLVVLFHAGSGRFPGGYVGVDVFFVLSGFLVTRLLLRDLTRGDSIRFGRFYSRRFRRLLPAAFVTLVLTAIVFSAIASPVEVIDAVDGFKAAFLYSTNWFFIHQASGYFGTDITTNPVLHFWSLAVEEQFYLLWPLLLGGLVVATRSVEHQRWRIVRGVVASGAVISLVLAWILRTGDPNHAYYGTDTRAYQLLAGAFVALTPSLITNLRRRERVARATAAGGLVALVLIAAVWPSLDAIARGTLVTVATMAIIVALEAARGGIARRVLSTEPLVYLGKISYGTYLWHWPVVIVITHSFDVASSTTVAMTVLVATALASLSYQLLERPIRVSSLLDRHRRTVIAVGLATSVIAALLIIPAIVNSSASTASPESVVVNTAGFTPVPKVDWNAVKTETPFPNCLGKPVDACTLVHGTGAHILLIGDSHANMLVPMFTAIAKTEDLTLSVTAQGGCPWQRGLYVPPIAGPQADCKGIRDDLYDRVVPELHPDVVVTVNAGYEQPRQSVVYLGPDGNPLSATSPEFQPWIEKATADSLAQLEAGGRKVVLVEPIPYEPKFDPVNCLSAAAVVQECRFVTDPAPTIVEQLYRKLDADNDTVWSLDLDNVVCPYLPICDPIVNNQVVRWDPSHLTNGFAESIAPAVDDYLTQNAIITKATS